MLRDAAVARVKQGLAFKTNLDTEIVLAFQELQADLETSSELPWFLRKKFDPTYVTVASQRTLAVPTDFIREWDDDPMSIIYSDGTSVITQELYKDSPAYLKLKWPQETLPLTDVSVPKAYVRINDTFYFYPLPSAAYAFDGSYYFKDQLLTTNIENQWLKELPYILVARAGLQLAQGLRDKEALTSFGIMNDVFTAKLHLATTADDMAGTGKLVMGGED